MEPNTGPQTEKKNSEAADSKDPETSNEWIVLFTAVLAIVAVLQLATIIWQILTTRNTAQKELQAYVFPVSARRFIENRLPKIKMILRNSGKTPAIECIAEIFEGVGPIVKPLPKLPKVVVGRSVRSVSFIPSDGEIWILDDGVAVSATEADAVKNDRGALYLIGTITYRDVFKRQHTSRCRFMCSGKNFDEGTFVVCDEGNGIE